jgi:hypothetical protein
MHRLALVLSALVLAVGCDGDIALENSRPAVTWVEVAPLPGDQCALTFWIKDAEGEAVDVEVIWSAGADGDLIALAPGSAPLWGLPTELGLNTDEGQVHRVIWDLEGVPDGEVSLKLTVDDRPYEAPAGETFTVTLDPRMALGPVAATRVSLRD